MYKPAVRNLRTVERFLLVPPLSAEFGGAPVSVTDISAGGARFRHDGPLETGRKGVLRVPMEARPGPVALEAVVVWSQTDSATPGQFVSGVRTWGAPEVIRGMIAELQTSNRSNRIEELRSSDRFAVHPALEATFGSAPVSVEDLSARGARIETASEAAVGTRALLEFHVPSSELDVNIYGTVVWTGVKSIAGEARTWGSGLDIAAKPELMRLAIALLTEQKRATLDTQSLVLKLKIIRARARQLAPAYRSIESSGVPAEQFLLIQGVREELRLNPEQAMHWYRRARLVINDPKTRAIAPMIVDHPDALAIWEYLDRSVDASLVGRALEIR